MKKDFKHLAQLWKEYNYTSLLLTKAMNGTANEVGEFAEQLVAEYYEAIQLDASSKSADLKTKTNKLIQVKSRKLEKIKAESLNVIRSWDFDLLVVVIFSKQGNVLKAIEIASGEAQNLSNYSDHQNGHILTTSKKLLDNEKSKDITAELQAIIDNEVIIYKTIDLSSNDIIKTNFEIELIPNNEKLFKENLLIAKEAKRTWFYDNGRIEKDIWNANNFKKSSNLRQNINSNNKVKNRLDTGLIRLKIEL